MKSFIVYLVTNEVNGKVYIGKTGGYLSSRRLAHFYDSRRGSSMYFHRALRKYGEDNFTWEVLSECSTEEQSFNAEKYWIKSFRSNEPLCGYNMTAGGEGMEGLSPSLETRQKMSASQRGKKIPPSSVEKSRVAKFKPVICLETGEVYKSQLEASQKLNIAKVSISSACRGKIHTAGGFHWALYFEGMDNTPKEFPPLTTSLETKEKLSKYNCKKVICIEKGIVYRSLQKAAESVGIKSSSSITWACQNASRTVAGFHWQYVDSLEET